MLRPYQKNFDTDCVIFIYNIKIYCFFIVEFKKIETSILNFYFVLNLIFNLFSTSEIIWLNIVVTSSSLNVFDGFWNVSA